MIAGYRFIVVCKNAEFYNHIYGKVNELGYAYFDNNYPHGKIKNLLYRIHNSKKINKFVKIPFKEMWISSRIRYYEKKLNAMQEKKEGICFLLFSDCIVLEEYGFSKRIKEKFPNAKVVYFFQDLVCMDDNKQKLLSSKPKEVDLIYSFDLDDAEKYNLLFHNVPYSFIDEYKTFDKPEYDVCFIGAAKNRLNDIIGLYEKLKVQGVKCNFYVTDVPYEEQKYREEIHYCKPMKYERCIEIIKNSKCILEVIQKGGTGNTIRVNEAIAYNKLLLSNNISLRANPIYVEDNMFIIENAECTGVIDFLGKYPVFYQNRECLTPRVFLKEIEEYLKE